MHPLSRRLAALCFAALVVVLAASSAIGQASPPEGSPSAALEGVALQAANVAGIDAIPLGAPGTSFRFVQQFGEEDKAFLEDTNHFYQPWGLASHGNDIWIADSWGLRLLKFDSAGSFLQQIGAAGNRHASGTALDFVRDVAVDGSGNVWVVEGGARHVIKFSPDGEVLDELGEAWNGGTANHLFNDPLSIAFDSAGNIYICDSGLWGDYGNQRVQVFSSSGTYIATLGQTSVAGSDNNHFRSPRHIAIYGDVLYVADSGNHRVQVFDVSAAPTVTYLATLGVTGESGNDNGHLNEPQAVAVDAGRIYVADTSNRRVQIFDRASRAYIATLGTGNWGTEAYDFKWPTDVAVDAAGRIYVADSGNMRVQQYDSTLTYLRTYGTTGVPYVTDGSHYNMPAGVASGADGSIFIVEERGHRLVKVNAKEEPQWTVGEPGVFGDDNTHLNWPRDVDLDTSGQVYVADSNNHRVQIFDANGQYVATLGNGWGSGNDQFKNVQGVAVGTDGRIYVADRDNHRIQIFGSGLAYIGTIGETGVSGSDNGHFNGLLDVAVDQAGAIYVLDQNNHRVQVFDSNRNYVRTLGISGECGYDFAHLCNPTAVAADDVGRTYVADSWGSRIQVFDASGGYLTTINHIRSRSPQVYGIDTDGRGAVYLAEELAHTVVKHQLGVPGWQQVNINAFGDITNGNVNTLASFKGQLYAGTYNNQGKGAQLWHMNGSGLWSQAAAPGFGIATTIAVNVLREFNGNLYAGVRNDDVGGAVYRSSDGGTWNPVATGGFGDPNTIGVYRFEVFDGHIYAGTGIFTTTHGAEIWRSASGDNGSWERVVENGLGEPDNYIIRSSAVHDGYLYFGTQTVDTSDFMTTTGGIVIRSATGDAGSWSQVTADGLGDRHNYMITGLVSFGGHLYAGTGRWDVHGAEVWRCDECAAQGDWERVVENGFGNPYAWGSSILQVYAGSLYLVIGNGREGLEVWRSASGDAGSWERVASGGFGDRNSQSVYMNGVTVFNDRLYLGVTNNRNGPEVWTKTPKTFLPLVR